MIVLIEYRKVVYKSRTWLEAALKYYPGQKKEPSLWCIMWYRRICSLISLWCIDAWSRGSRKSRSLAVPQLNQAPGFLNITRFWFNASAAWFFFFVQGSRSRNFSELKLHISRTRIEAAARKKQPSAVDVGQILLLSNAKCLFTFEINSEQLQCQVSLSLIFTFARPILRVLQTQDFAYNPLSNKSRTKKLKKCT